MSMEQTVRAKIQKHRKSPKSAEVDLRADPSVVYSIVPAETLYDLGIQPDEDTTIAMPGGTEATRRTAGAYMEVAGRSGYTRVAFGKEGDPAVLGRMALDILALALDPNVGRLQPLT